MTQASSAWNMRIKILWKKQELKLQIQKKIKNKKIKLQIQVIKTKQQVNKSNHGMTTKKEGTKGKRRKFAAPSQILAFENPLL